MKIFAFFALVLVVAFAVYAGAQSQTGSTRKHSKYLIKFGSFDTDNPDCSNRSLIEIHNWFKGPPMNTTDDEAKKRYKARQYNGEGAKPGPDLGDLKDICLPPLSSAATSSADGPAPPPSPKSTKTQTSGFAMLDKPEDAAAFENFVNK